MYSVKNKQKGTARIFTEQLMMTCLLLCDINAIGDAANT